MKLTDFFQRAQQIVTGHHADRDVKREGGEYETQWAQTARVYTALTGQTMTEQNALVMMQCVKLVRAQRDPKFNADHYDDLMGYTALAGMAKFNQRGTASGASGAHHLGDAARFATGAVFTLGKHPPKCDCPQCLGTG